MKKLFIIHGWTYSIEPWTAAVSVLKTRGYEVTQLRVPGLTTESDQPYTMADYTAWLKDELVREKDVVLLGHSNGGRIALALLAQEPKLVKQLLLLNSAGAKRSGKIRYKRRVLRLATKVFSPIKHVPLLRKAVYRLLGSDYNAAPPHMKQTLAHMLAADATLNIEAVTTPTQLLWGAKDTATPLADAQQLVQRLPHAELTVFDAWSHAPYSTHPYELACAIDAAYSKVVT